MPGGHPVLSLPMRNWNRRYVRFSAFSKPRSQPTYEELKPFFKGDIKGFHRVLSLPMRNWNWMGRANRCGNSPFSAYLWGIETTTPPPGAAYPACPFSAYLWGIETKGINVKRDDVHCSQPTYEELKLKVVKLFACRLSVLSLPMRNWNAPLSTLYCSVFHVLSLPMRNWN